MIISSSASCNTIRWLRNKNLGIELSAILQEESELGDIFSRKMFKRADLDPLSMLCILDNLINFMQMREKSVAWFPILGLV